MLDHFSSLLSTVHRFDVSYYLYHCMNSPTRLTLKSFGVYAYNLYVSFSMRIPQRFYFIICHNCGWNCTHCPNIQSPTRISESSQHCVVCLSTHASPTHKLCISPLASMFCFILTRVSMLRCVRCTAALQRRIHLSHSSSSIGRLLVVCLQARIARIARSRYRVLRCYHHLAVQTLCTHTCGHISCMRRRNWMHSGQRHRCVVIVVVAIQHRSYKNNRACCSRFKQAASLGTLPAERCATHRRLTHTLAHS